MFSTIQDLLFYFTLITAQTISKPYTFRRHQNLPQAPQENFGLLTVLTADTRQSMMVIESCTCSSVSCITILANWIKQGNKTKYCSCCDKNNKIVMKTVFNV